MLSKLDVLVIDCQASGATPEHGDLLELGWAVSRPEGLHPVEAHWVRPKTDRPIPAPIRRLLGWSDACLESAIPAEDAWSKLLSVAHPGMPTLIHWARFELPFLRELHGGEPPLDVRCLHAIADRLLPDLPKKNIRALAGHLGHSTELLRRARGHVEATAFAWRALAPRLEREGVATWADLATFLARPAPARRGAKPVFPYPSAERRLLPDAPGVYRFLRSNGDVLYVGKATSIKKRVASHFSSKRGKDDALEMLTQVAHVTHTETGSVLEAALLEVAEIHRLDPPYNVQLRVADRRVWFASRRFDDVRDTPDDDHTIGPLPSERAVRGLAAMTKLLDGAEPDPEVRAAAVGVPVAFAPDAETFAEVWRAFAPAVPLLDAARALHPLREDPSDDEDDDLGWTPERVQRHLVRTLAGEGLLVRRARLLALLVDAQVTFTEADRAGADVGPRSLGGPSTDRPRSRRARQLAFDARLYDRLRVLATELRRVHLEGGTIALTIGGHRLRASTVFAGL